MIGNDASAQSQPADTSGSADARSLAPVSVTSPRRSTGADPFTPHAGGQVALGAQQGLLGNTSVMDTPYSVVGYTQEYIANQQARSIADVIVDDPSVRTSSSRYNINEDFTIRGYAVPSQDIGFNGLYGVTPYFRVPIEMAERIEVIKGPTAFINGMAPAGSVGGTINLVPKRAGLEPLTRFTASYLSDSVLGGHADVGRRFGPRREIGVRLNGVYRKGDAVVDHVRSEDLLGSLGLDYLGERLRLSADVIYQDQSIDKVVRQFQAAPTLTALPAAPSGRTNYPGVGFDRMRDQSNVLHGEYDLSDALTAYASYGQRRSRMNALAGNPLLLDSAGNYSYSPAWQVFGVSSKTYEAGVRAAFATGPIRHRAVLGYTDLRQQQSIYFNFGYPTVTANLNDPSLGSSPDLSGLNPVRVPYGDTHLSGIALADTASMLDDRLLVTLGARHQQVRQTSYNFVTGQAAGPTYDRSAVTPMAGVVFKLQPELSLYASYLEGLSQGETAPATASNAGAMLAPYKSKQKEIGLKLERGGLGATLALFELTRRSASVANNVFSLNGEQRNRGIEMTAFGRLARGVRVLGGASYYQALLNQTPDGINEGHRGVGVPRWQLNAGGEWDLPGLIGATLSGRVIYTGSMYNDAGNVLQVPAWTRLDLGARYATKVSGKPVLFRLNVENATDRHYWGTSTSGYLFLGAPRTVMLSATTEL